MSRLRLGGQLCGSQPAGQELVSVSVGEDIENNGVRALRMGKRRELAAAGHDGSQAVAAARQQRPTCAALAALSSMTSIRRPATTVRACPSSPARIGRGGGHLQRAYLRVRAWPP